MQPRPVRRVLERSRAVIFSPELLPKVLDGTKTVTRRRSYREPGRTYAVQPGRGKKAVARIKIKFATPSQAFLVDDAEARLEGFEDVEAFREAFKRIYGPNALYDPCWRLQFEVVE